MRNFLAATPEAEVVSRKIIIVYISKILLSHTHKDLNNPNENRRKAAETEKRLLKKKHALVSLAHDSGEKFFATTNSTIPWTLRASKTLTAKNATIYAKNARSRASICRYAIFCVSS
ncbi:MAG: hypothetical protein LBF59_06535 [Prevotellaceae bacterium]|nr:hypothetical protein [Prevotellaceae bacterium]